MHNWNKVVTKKCCDVLCRNYDEYKPIMARIIDKAKELDISVTDVNFLINLEGEFRK